MISLQGWCTYLSLSTLYVDHSWFPQLGSRWWAREAQFYHRWVQLGQLLLFGQNGYCSGRMVIVRAEWLLFGQNGYCSGRMVIVRAEWLLFGQNGYCSGRMAIVRAEWLLFGQNGYCSGRMVIVRAEWLLFGQNGYCSGRMVIVRAEWLLFGQNGSLYDIDSLLTHWGRVTHICVGNLTSLVQIMACRLDGAKPLPEPMLEYC